MSKDVYLVYDGHEDFGTNVIDVFSDEEDAKRLVAYLLENNPGFYHDAGYTTFEINERFNPSDFPVNKGGFLE